MQFRDEVLPIQSIPNFSKIVYKITENKDWDKLGSFSKVLALLILERQRKKFSKTFENKFSLRLFPNPKPIEINEWILVKAPELIENMVFYLSKNSKKLLNCHTLVSRIFGITNRTASSSVSSERETHSNISLPQNFQNMTFIRPASDYISASVEIKVSAATGSKDSIEKYLTNQKAAEFIFNSPLLDTIKVK